MEKSWADYKLRYPGKIVSKQVFASVFKEAWFNTLQPSKLQNTFKASGIYPTNFGAISKSCIAPSTIFDTLKPLGNVPPNKPAKNKYCEAVLKALEEVLTTEQPELYKKVQKRI